MNASMAGIKPKFFIIFRVSCILIGIFGLIGSMMSIILFSVPSIKEVLESQGQTFQVVLLGMIQSLILLIASILLFKLREIGRILILACTMWSLLQAVYYFIRSYSSLPLMSLSNLFSISFIAVNVFIFLYFMRRDVKAYVTAHG